MRGLNKRPVLLLGFLFFMSVFFLSFVSSASGMTADNVTIVTPGASGTLTGGSAVFNCSLQAGYEAENWTRVRVYLQSAGKTANTTEALAVSGWILNTTSLDLNGTLNSTWFEDGNDYTFKCQLWNGTNYINKTRTGITVNNTVPVAPTISPVDQTVRSTAGTQTFTGTVTDSKTTSCTYTIYRQGSSSDGNAGSGSYSGSSCTFSKTFSTSADNGNWYVTITASDENDRASTTTHYVVNIPGAGGGGNRPLSVAGEEGTTILSGDNSFWIVFGIVIVILGVIVFLILRKKK